MALISFDFSIFFCSSLSNNPPIKGTFESKDFAFSITHFKTFKGNSINPINAEVNPSVNFVQNPPSDDVNPLIKLTIPIIGANITLANIFAVSPNPIPDNILPILVIPQFKIVIGNSTKPNNNSPNPALIFSKNVPSVDTNPLMKSITPIKIVKGHANFANKFGINFNIEPKPLTALIAPAAISPIPTKYCPIMGILLNHPIIVEPKLVSVEKYSPIVLNIFDALCAPPVKSSDP